MENYQYPKADKHIGDYLHRTMRIKVMELLWKERLSRGISLEEMALKSCLNLKHLKKVECNFRDMNWFSAAVMLKFFNKRIVLTLEDLGDDCKNLILTRKD